MNTQTALLNVIATPILTEDDQTIEYMAAGDQYEGGWLPFSIAHLDSNGRRYYRVIDWIAGIEQRDDVRDLWDDIRIGIIEDLGPIWVIPFGNIDDSEYALAEDLLTIAAYIDSRI